MQHIIRLKNLSSCGVWEIRAGVQVSKREFYTHIHLDYIRNSILYIKKKINYLGFLKYCSLGFLEAKLQIRVFFRHQIRYKRLLYYQVFFFLLVKCGGLNPRATGHKITRVPTRLGGAVVYRITMLKIIMTKYIYIYICYSLKEKIQVLNLKLLFHLMRKKFK